MQRQRSSGNCPSPTLKDPIPFTTPPHYWSEGGKRKDTFDELISSQRYVEGRHRSSSLPKPLSVLKGFSEGFFFLHLLERSREGKKGDKHCRFRAVASSKKAEVLSRGATLTSSGHLRYRHYRKKRVCACVCVRVWVRERGSDNNSISNGITH